MRPDLSIIADLIKPGARVLDLGCGEGELLAHLQAHKRVNGYGLDVDADNITICVRKGVNVIEQDLDAGLTNFPDDSFDMVVMTETLQSVRQPAQMLNEMLRIGQECIVTFPNFAHWRRPRPSPLQRPHAYGPAPAPQLARHPQHPPMHVEGFRAAGAGHGLAHHPALRRRR